MSHGRRTTDRRRRVLYSAYHADDSPSTAASRREAERLRQARRPAEAYGARVHRRLRARWFSLVPVRRRTTILVAGLLAGLALLLCGGHYASVAWAPIAYRPEIARPLRLDRPDSFGRWFTIALLASSAGASLLIYQLRRYRNDDFKGRYRLWRLVLVVLTLASVNSLVSIIDWGGALLDAAFGKRVALTGSDWIRLIVSLGGAVLALQLIAEVRRCRFALGMMILACALLAIPEAAKWNVMQVDSIASWVAVTSAPLLGFTCLFVSLGAYLRMLYREVRRIEEDDSLLQRMQKMRLRWFQRSVDSELDPDEQQPPRGRKRRWLRRSRRTDVPSERDDVEPDEFEEEEQAEEQYEDDSPDVSGPRRRWLGLRRAKPQPTTVDQDDGQNGLPAEPESGDDSSARRGRKKRRRFSMRLAPRQAESVTAEENAGQQQEEGASEEVDDQQPRRRRGLGGWLRRKQAAESGEDAAATDSEADPQQTDDVDSDEIDWNSMSKAERRRLRKQLKRKKRAA